MLWEGSVGSFGLDTVVLPGGRARDARAASSTRARRRWCRSSTASTWCCCASSGTRRAASIWEVPAGKLDRGEDPAVCAVRELEEETGYRAGRVVQTGAMLTTPGFTDERIHLFCAYDLDARARRGRGARGDPHARWSRSSGRSS